MILDKNNMLPLSHKVFGFEDKPCPIPEQDQCLVSDKKPVLVSDKSNALSVEQQLYPVGVQEQHVC